MRLFLEDAIVLVITGFMSFLVFLSLFLFITYNWFNDINKKYIDQNTALVGAIIENNPELERKNSSNNN